MSTDDDSSSGASFDNDDDDDSSSSASSDDDDDDDYSSAGASYDDGDENVAGEWHDGDDGDSESKNTGTNDAAGPPCVLLKATGQEQPESITDTASKKKVAKLQETARELFPVDHAKFYDKQELLESLRSRGDSAGFLISSVGSSFRCSKAWENRVIKKARKKRQGQVSTFKRQFQTSTRCEFIIRFACLKGHQDKIKITSTATKGVMVIMTKKNMQTTTKKNMRTIKYTTMTMTKKIFRHSTRHSEKDIPRDCLLK